MFRKVKFSIRFKLLITILVLLTSSVSLYFLYAANLFRQDKEAYIYEQGLNHGKALARRSKNYFDKAAQDLAIISSLRLDPEQMSLMNNLFESNTHFISLDVLNLENKTIFTLRKTEAMSQQNIDSELINQFIDEWKPQIASLQSVTREVRYKKIDDGDENHGVFLLGMFDPANNVYLVSTLNPAELIRDFGESKIYESILFDTKGTILINPTNKHDNVKPGEGIGQVVFSKALTGSQRIIDEAGRIYLITFSTIEDLGLKIVSLIEYKEAFRAITFLIQMSGIFAVFIICIGVISSILGAKTLTQPVQALMEGTVAVGHGDFTTKVEVKSQDELGVLGDSFNYMQGEILKYMDEVKEKTRMEGELAVAQLVQNSFFPNQSFENNLLQIAGSYQSASECGGDWWGFSEINDKTIVFIGDATGHGVPAALITATAYTSVNIIEDLSRSNPEISLSPDKILEQMNHAVYKMGGQILMTFFVGVIDHKSKMLTYANASHNPPFLLTNNAGGSPTKEDIMPLDGNPGYRLGQNADSTYEAFQEQLKPGDVLTVFTDGVTEGTNHAGREYGERRFYKSIINHSSKDATEILNSIVADAEDFYDGVENEDDVTLAVVKLKI